MKKIFISPEVKTLTIESTIICQSNPGLNSGTSTVGNSMGSSEDGWNDDAGYGFAPVRMDIFNYGGLQ